MARPRGARNVEKVYADVTAAVEAAPGDDVAEKLLHVVDGEHPLVVKLEAAKLWFGIFCGRMTFGKG
jgi:hypothetical protein